MDHFARFAFIRHLIKNAGHRQPIFPVFVALHSVFRRLRRAVISIPQRSRRSRPRRSGRAGNDFTCLLRGATAARRRAAPCALAVDDGDFLQAPTALRNRCSVAAMADGVHAAQVEFRLGGTLPEAGRVCARSNGLGLFVFQKIRPVPAPSRSGCPPQAQRPVGGDGVTVAFTPILRSCTVSPTRTGRADFFSSGAGSSFRGSPASR